MRKVSILVFCLFVSSSFCNVNKVYGKINYKIMTIESSYDDVWKKTIEFLVMNNFQIITINKDSGVIVSTNVEIDQRYLNCRRPKKSFWSESAVKLKKLGNDGYLSIKIDDNDSGVDLIVSLKGVAQWGATIGIESNKCASCNTTGVFENAYFSYLRGEDFNIIDNDDCEQILSLLGSEDFNVVRETAKKVYNAGAANPIIYDKFESILLSNYRDETKVSLRIDTLAWLCRVLGDSGDNKYKNTLAEVGKNATFRKIRNYAKQAFTNL